MEKIKIKQASVKKYRKDYPLIQDIDLVTYPKELPKGWVSFYTQHEEFIGYGYLGKQNKGIGWLISFKENQPLKPVFFSKLFNEAKQERQSFFLDESTTAFRLFNGEGDGLGGMTIDWYDGYLVVSWYNETIYGLKHEILKALQQSDIPVIGIYEKVRFKKDGLQDSSFLWGEKAPEPLIVKENNINYATYLNEGLMTGIFLDQRDVRRELSEGLSTGKTLLNTFSYTGAFSVAAAYGGATHTTSVDLAKRSLEKTKEQFEVNGIDGDKQAIIVMDVFDYFKYALRKEMAFDIVVMDPPSFARNKKRTFSVAKDYGKLTYEAAQLVKQNGLLIASTNAANVSMDKFRSMVENGIKETGRTFSLSAKYHLPTDFKVSDTFKEANYLKVLFYNIK